MSDNAVSIRVTQRRIQPKVLGIPVPFSSYIATNTSYSFPNGSGHGGEDGSNPFEGLASLLVNTELNRSGRQLGPIHVVFEFVNDYGRSYGLGMEALLKIYARSEQTTVDFQYRN